MNEQDLLDREAPGGAPARDPEAAQRALVRVQHVLDKQRRVEALVHRDATPAEDRKPLVEQLVQRQHITELRNILDRLHPADIAYILEALPLEDRLVVWDCVKADRDGEILMEVNDAVRETLIASMDHEELVDAVEGLEADEIAHIADDLPADVVEEIQEGLSAEERAQLRASMSYPDDSVGALMDFEMITIREDVTLEVVLRYLRRFDELPSQTDQLFVVDRDEKLLGVLPVNALIVNDPDVLVERVMRPPAVKLLQHEKADEAASAFERYDLVSAPVVDTNERLVGRVTVDEVLDFVRASGEETMRAQAGLRAEEDIFASVWDSFKNRWAWLAINLVTAFIASRVIGAFEGTIEKLVALAALMPIIAGIGGNSGNQTITMIVRALALGQVQQESARVLLRKEIGVAMVNGLIWGSLLGFVAWWLYRSVALGAVMTAAMMLNLIVAATVGVAVPLLRQRLGYDPAIGSSVLITAVTDSGGFFIFLGLATLFLL